MLFVDFGVNKVCCCCNVTVLCLRMIINFKNIYTIYFPDLWSGVYFFGKNSNKTIHQACVTLKYKFGEHAQLNLVVASFTNIVIEIGNSKTCE